MDPYEATKIVFSRIQSLDPENTSKIMGLLLIQGHGEKEMIRLAFGSESLLYSVVVKARQDLGISSHTSSTPSTPSSPSPFLGGNGNPFSLSWQNSSSSSSRFVSGGNGLHIPSSICSISSLPSPSSVPSPSWAPSVFYDIQNPEEHICSNSSSTSYVSGISSLGVTSSSNSSMNPSSPPFYGSGTGELLDEIQLQEQLSFLNDNSSPTFASRSADIAYPQPDFSSSPTASGASESMLFPYSWGSESGGGGVMHKRSFSVGDISLDDPASGLGWKPCLYFARGYCKNGASCRFVHGGRGLSDSNGLALSPIKVELMEQCNELLRSKSMQYQKLMPASQLLASTNSFPFSANKCMNFLAQRQQNQSPRAAAAMMMVEDVPKFGRSRPDRNDFLMNGRGDLNSCSRQIYLTFPADSTFKEEDVSNYFSIYGPVQDVRIPYQQKRMFGFVTFVYPETVKIILAKGNPHFVCDARVLVKPYKEKGKVPDKCRKQQQLERREFSACNSPAALDSGDPFDIQLGARLMYNTQDMLRRRKLEEQADLHQALEVQSRKIMDLQLLDVERKHHNPNLYMGAPIPSTQSSNFMNQEPLISSDRSSPDEHKENVSSLAAISATDATDQKLQRAVIGADKAKDEDINGRESSPPHLQDENLPESLEHDLPDSPFSYPTKGPGEYLIPVSSSAGEAESVTSSANGSLIASSLLPASSTLDMASFKSCYFQMPRFSPGHGAIGM
ncbi:hypothetical protein Nepgr_017564 [Nepenthes gracilis]|uniref:Uncharacterized protein n=1 Tax=Nepenthes gracilis TaxID=150966 RepID=A0AAD3SPK6_NEPGR|nr:hypothetical protein Nepgr_017564 [Nepenthes gracilis]